MDGSSWVKGNRDSTTGNDVTTSHSSARSLVGQVGQGVEARSIILGAGHDRRGELSTTLSMELWGHQGNSMLSLLVGADCNRLLQGD